MQVYLIEVNTCPALALRGAVLQDLLPRVMEEVVQKAVDPLFPPPATPPKPSSSSTPVSAVDGELNIAQTDVAVQQQQQQPRPQLNGFVPLPLVQARRSLAERTSSLTQLRSNSMTEGRLGALSRQTMLTHNFTSFWTCHCHGCRILTGSVSVCST